MSATCVGCGQPIRHDESDGWVSEVDGWAVCSVLDGHHQPATSTTKEDTK